MAWRSATKHINRPKVPIGLTGRNAPILFEDNHLLVVNKPSGVPTQGDSSKDVNLWESGKQYIIKKYLKPGNAYLSTLQRLDRPVSGVCMFARTGVAAERMGKDFASRSIEKQYVAIVHGELKDSGTIEGGGSFSQYWEGRTWGKSSYQPAVRQHAWDGTQDDKQRKHEDKVDGPSEYDIIVNLGVMPFVAGERDEYRDVTAVAIRPSTGRKHQIRRQLAALGHPIVGDALYGSSKVFEDKSILLHAYSLEFDHPKKEELVPNEPLARRRLKVFCEVPAHWQAKISSINASEIKPEARLGRRVIEKKVKETLAERQTRLSREKIKKRNQISWEQRHSRKAKHAERPYKLKPQIGQDLDDQFHQSSGGNVDENKQGN